MIHFQLTFDGRYPVTAPECRLFTPLPHLNVRKDLPLAAAPYRVSIWDCNPSENGWSSAYTVHSVLLQLPVILFDDGLLHQGRSRLIQQQLQNLEEFQCRACAHSGETPSHEHGSSQLPSHGTQHQSRCLLTVVTALMRVPFHQQPCLRPHKKPLNRYIITAMPCARRQRNKGPIDIIRYGGNNLRAQFLAIVG